MTKFEEVRRKVAQLRTEASKAEGAVEQLLRTLKSEFNCTSLDEAREHLSSLKSDLAEKETEFEEKLQEFCDEFAEELGKL